jgi:hypothetical protein
VYNPNRELSNCQDNDAQDSAFICRGNMSTAYSRTPQVLLDAASNVSLTSLSTF